MRHGNAAREGAEEGAGGGGRERERERGTDREREGERAGASETRKAGEKRRDGAAGRTHARAHKR